MDLYEWTKHYITFKDVMKKQIQNISYDKHSIYVKEKNKNKLFLVFEDFGEGIAQSEKNKEENIYIVSLNTKKNAQTLIKKWKNVSKNNNLTCIFAHPATNEKWIIHPATHNNISEEKNLSQGIMTLYESITPI